MDRTPEKRIIVFSFEKHLKKGVALPHC